MDLFEREQSVFDKASELLKKTRASGKYDINDFERLLKEYGRLLRQIRRFTSISDRTTDNLNASKLDLLSKVHFDELTGLYNRRFMEENFRQHIKSISRYGGILSVLMLDIDFFKFYNDTYGHQAGDICLKSVAQAIKSCVTRGDDFVARYGGEEFVAVLPNTNNKGACLIAKNILEKIRQCDIKHEKSRVAGFVTISIGVTTGNVEHYMDFTHFIKRADKALYMSKQTGRNKYTFVDFKEDID
ncbi:MAG: GGDEF domain-containing protein [Eubacterium sp.]|jgi:diguanylate cyclase (GGDEF)-like protein|nr:GGDEF domain-containing protein [Eubacterium sp.]